MDSFQTETNLKHAHHGYETKVYKNVCPTQLRFAYVPAVVQQNSIVEVVGSDSCEQGTVSGSANIEDIIYQVYLILVDNNNLNSSSLHLLPLINWNLINLGGLFRQFSN